MGILNVTPDSFSDGGDYYAPEAAVERAIQMAAEGADIVDIGGESSRPGAHPVPATEEMRRLFPVIEQLRAQSDIPISVDTRKAEVARGALERGATWINDISAATFDPRMIDVVVRFRANIILAHMRGTPATMQGETDYEDVVSEVKDYLVARARTLEAQGVGGEQIILDPGLGFAKTFEQNLELVRSLKVLVDTGYPILIGASRKSFIQKMLGDDSSNVLEGSLAVAAWAIGEGCALIRVHDVNETVRLARVLSKIGQ